MIWDLAENLELLETLDILSSLDIFEQSEPRLFLLADRLDCWRECFTNYQSSA
jgi:hypothetical protein